MFNMFLQVPRRGIVKTTLFVGSGGKLLLHVVVSLETTSSPLAPPPPPTPDTHNLVHIHGVFPAAVTHQLNASSNVRRMTVCLS